MIVLQVGEIARNSASGSLAPVRATTWQLALMCLTRCTADPDRDDAGNQRDVRCRPRRHRQPLLSHESNVSAQEGKIKRRRQSARLIAALDLDH
jgi:hypothetical protein